MKTGSRLCPLLFGFSAIIAVAAAFWARPAIRTEAETQSRHGTVLLTGPEASDYLSQNRDGQSLMQAITASGFNIRSKDAKLGDQGGAYVATNSEHNFTASFEADNSVQVRSNGVQHWQIGLRLKSFGYGDDLLAVNAGEMKVEGNRIEISRRATGEVSSAGLVEWYVNKSDGLEQGFTLPAPPRKDRGAATSSPNRLRLTMEWTGDLRGELADDAQEMLLKDAQGQKIASYNHLKAWDATGRELPARMQVRGRELSLEVEDAGAMYPVTIDPTLQVEIKLIAQNGEAKEELGRSVAISGDTAIVGAPRPDSYPTPGAAYIFVRNGATWTEQAKLVAGGDNGGRDTYFGAAVAISGDLAVVGDTNGFTDDGSFLGRLGAVFVFSRSAGVWSLEKKLLADEKVGNDQFGYSVGISGDTVVVGAPWDDFTFPETSQRGAAYVFVRDSGSWTQRAKLIPSDGVAGDEFGKAVALSGDYAIIGAPFRFDRDGAAYIFFRGSTGWVEEDTLTGDNATPGEGFGYSVAISENTAIAGVLHDVARNSTLGAAYVFVRDGTAWPRQQKLVGDSTADRFFGYSVAISNDVVLVGDPFDDQSTIQVPGQAYLFVRNSGTWSQYSRLTASDGALRDAFGFSVGINPSGIPLVGAPGHDIGANANQGQVYIFGSPDTDGDGIPDDWEVNGVTVEGVFLDLKAMGANPRHKDIFVHADWMAKDPTNAQSKFKPDPRAIKMVIDAFSIAPGQKNPDGKPGINLHVDLGTDSIMDPVTGGTWGPLSRAGDVPFEASLGSFTGEEYNWDAVDLVKEVHFGPAKRGGVFHYALFGNTYGGSTSSGISRDTPGTDFLVMLGTWPTPGGTVLQQAGTFMHELGHNLGLQHGGNEEVPMKPNYLSVMNYAFQLEGLLKANGQRSFDYSKATLPSLDELNLNEGTGIGDSAVRLTLWSKFTRPDVPAGSNACLANPEGYFKLLLPGGALDWNCDGNKASAPVVADLNEDGICVDVGDNNVLDTIPSGDDEIRDGKIISGANRRCDIQAAGDDEQVHPVGFIQPRLLTGATDWSTLVFDGGGKIGGAAGAGLPGPGTTAQTEPTRKHLLAIVPPALLAEELVAPLDVVTRSPLSGAPPLTVNFNGAASTAVTGTIVKWEWDFGDSTIGTGATVAHTYTAPGDYFASLTVTDSNGRVNLVPLLYSVSVAGSAPTNAPNLTPYTPPGWSSEIVVSKTTGTNTDDGPLLPTDTLYVDWAVTNDGDVATAATFSTKLFVDGVEKQNLNTGPPMNPGAVIGVQDFSIGSLSEGPHTVRIQTDATQVIAEKKETDNAFTRTIVIKSLSTPTPTPTPTASPTPTGSPPPTVTPTPTGTPIPTPTPTATPAGPLPGRRITKVADTADGFPGSFSVTTINNSRTVVFGAQRSDYIGLFTKTADGPWQDVADFNALGGPPEGLWAINEAGQVGFMIRPGQTGFPGSSDRFKIYRSDGGVVTKLAETTPFGPAGTFSTFSGTFVSINDNGTVSFWAQLNGGGSAISRVDSGGILSTAVDTMSGVFTGLYAGARMNQSGVIAFGASTPSGLGIFTVAPDGTLSTIATRPADFEGLDFNPAINSSGTVAFLGETKTIRGVFTGKGGALTTIAQATREFGTDPFLDFSGLPAINDAGTVVFKARLRSAPENGGIFTGPNFVAGKLDPTAVDKVIAIGDVLFGSTVETLYFNGALNQNGDIAFSYGLKNRTEGVAIASPLPTALANISTRLAVQTGDDALIGGFIITGTEPKKVIVRAIGPSLGSVEGRLADPTLELYNSAGQAIAFNDNWKDAQQAEIEATTIPPTDQLESAVVRTLNPGAYTAIVRGNGNTTGIGLVEAYDLDRTSDSKLANISTRGPVQTGDDVLIGGFIVLGNGPQKVVIRVSGPSLNIAGKLADPHLELRNANGDLLRDNDNWRTGGQEAEIMQSGLQPTNDLESALIQDLPANGANYTAIVRGAGETAGVAVVEVYALN